MNEIKKPEASVASQAGTNPYLSRMNFSRVVRPPAIKVAQGTSRVLADRIVQQGDLYDTNTNKVLVPFGNELYFVFVCFSNLVVSRVFNGNRLSDEKNTRSELSEKYLCSPLTAKNSHLVQRENCMEYIDPALEGNHPLAGKTVFHNEQLNLLVFPFLETSNSKGQFVTPPFQIPCERSNLFFARKLLAQIQTHLVMSPLATPWDHFYKVKVVSDKNKDDLIYYHLDRAMEGGRISKEIAAQAKQYEEEAQSYIRQNKLAFESDEEKSLPPPAVSSKPPAASSAS